MKTKPLSYQQINLTASSTSTQKTMWHFLANGFMQFCNAIANAIRADYEPKVWEHKDRQGTTYWRVYDPLSGYTMRFASEMEVRMWLENYYTHPFN